MVELLTEIGFENTADAFINNDFTIDGVMAIEKSDLTALGLNIGQAKQFLLSLQKYKNKKQHEKEEERKQSLKLVLEKVKRLDLLDKFIEKNIQPKDVWHLSVDDLAEMGISYWSRRGWAKSLSKINELGN